jgi:hypothetical protein
MSSGDLALVTTIGLTAEAAGIKRSICWAIISVLERSHSLAPAVLASLLGEDLNTVSTHLEALRSASIIDEDGGLTAGYRSGRQQDDVKGVNPDEAVREYWRAHKRAGRKRLGPTAEACPGHVRDMPRRVPQTAYKPTRYQSLGIPGADGTSSRTTVPYVDAYKSIEKEKKKKVARRSENAPEGRDFQEALEAFDPNELQGKARGRWIWPQEALSYGESRLPPDDYTKLVNALPYEVLVAYALGYRKKLPIKPYATLNRLHKELKARKAPEMMLPVEGGGSQASTSASPPPRGIDPPHIFRAKDLDREMPMPYLKPLAG